MPIKKSTRIAKALIDNEERIATSEAIESLDLLDFADALKRRLHYKGTKLRPLRNKPRLTLYPVYNEMHKLVLQKLCEIYQQKKRLFSRIWERVDLSVDISVWGGESWRPYLAPNGSILFRNYHRVIGLDGQYGQFGHDAARVRELLSPIFDELPEIDDITEFPSAFILHRDGDEGLYLGCKLPEKLSEWGQTLIFLKRELIDQLPDTDALIRAEQTSRSGYAIIRTFNDTSFVYSTGRFSDELDSILEYFSSYLDFETVNEPSFYKSICDGIREIRYITESIMGNEIGMGDPDCFGLISSELQEKIAMYSQVKFYQLSNSLSFFADSASYPRSYYNPGEPYFFGLTNYFGKDIVVLEIRNGGNESILGIDLHIDSHMETIGKAIKGKIKTLLAHYFISEDDPSSWSMVHVQWDYYLIDEDKKCNWIPLWQVANGLVEMMNILESCIEPMHEIYPDDFELKLLFVPNRFRSSDLDAINAAVLDITRFYNCGIMLHVPKYGISQGYDCGDHDTGNVADLLTGNTSPLFLPDDIPDVDETDDDTNDVVDNDNVYSQNEVATEPTFDELLSGMQRVLDELQAEMEAGSDAGDASSLIDMQEDDSITPVENACQVSSSASQKKSRKKKSP